jgi:hypothetical protein
MLAGQARYCGHTRKVPAGQGRDDVEEEGRFRCACDPPVIRDIDSLSRHLPSDRAELRPNPQRDRKQMCQYWGEVMRRNLEFR